jgi:MoaA/NifB/PqqE/SkfB family radical SAM enzyme
MPDSRRGNREGALTAGEYCAVVENARKEGMLCIEISGEGEPLLSKSMREVIQCGYDNDFITTVITNGHYLTEDLVQYCFERNVTIVVSLFSLNRERYEMDNSLPGSFDKTLNRIEMAAGIYRSSVNRSKHGDVYRIAVHTTAQSDNLMEINTIKSFCEEHRMFFSIAPLAPAGGGAGMQAFSLNEDQSHSAMDAGDNTIILSSSSQKELGREVCGTCLYGLNIGYDGNLLFDAHAGYEIQDSLGNVRREPMSVLIQRQRELVPQMFRSIDGYCPVRDPKWSRFLKDFLEEKEVPLGLWNIESPQGAAV